MYKVVAVCALFAAANSQATSFVSFNENHNSVNHVQSGPVSPKYSSYSSPASPKIALPVVAKVVPAPSYYSAPSLAAPNRPSYEKYDEEPHGPAKYEFAYIVQDPHTGDYHSQEEKRDGDHLIGQYSLHEADGTIRLVKYSDDGHGFNAVVERQGTPNPAPVAYKSY